MRNSWFVFSGLLIATSVGCEQKKSAVEQVAELQLEQRLEAEKNRKAYVEAQNAKAKAEEQAANRAASVALANLAQADIERTKAETRQAEINAQRERDRQESEALAAAEISRREKLVAAEKLRQEKMFEKDNAAEKLRREKMFEKNEKVGMLRKERSVFEKLFPEFSNGLLNSPVTLNRLGGTEQQFVLGLIQAQKSLAELEGLLMDVGQATLNPTLRNGPGQNGRLNFQSAKFRDTFKGNLNKDLGAVQRYIAGLESFDKDIAEAMK